MDETFDSIDFGWLEEYVSSHYIVLRELERVSERVVNMSLRRKVHNRVDFLRLQNEIHQIRWANVSLYELIVRQMFHAVQILRKRVEKLVEIRRENGLDALDMLLSGNQSFKWLINGQ